jgi:cytochrome oxidase Cu insertion factor (SCO1/SenC/PrrC family)
VNRVIACAVGLAFALAASAPAADPPSDEKTGIKVGEKAPAFKLKDQTGEERELSALLKRGPVALVFYRSASW